MIVTVYIDESGTHESGYTILGGWVGRLGQWATFAPKWKSLLKKNGLTYFHSNKMRQSKGEFKGWKIVQKRVFMNRAASLALNNLEFGFTVALNDEDYRRLYLSGGDARGKRLDSRYGLCFRHCLSFVPHHAIQAFKDHSDLDIQFVMEAGHKNYGDAERIFAATRNSTVESEQYIVRTLASLVSADKKDFAGLQVADVNAYGTFQHYTRSLLELTELEPGSSMSEAKKIQRVPIFHFPMHDEVICTYRKFIDDEQKEKEARKLARSARS
ncbi:DUF3800 domain-containing protein [Bradyrhizobium sp. AZCC 2230]|uniref:DUF3800 domain-containing protein n=1 Tax=Bradyrhizobium sp. AZCC 2230 TaxID=3117021 RepID=UPI002FF077B3